MRTSMSGDAIEPLPAGTVSGQTSLHVPLFGMMCPSPSNQLAQTPKNKSILRDCLLPGFRVKGRL